MQREDHVQRVMVVMAHPDDPEYVCGGSVARWAHEGREVVYVLATMGEAGSDDLKIPAPELARLRLAEQESAARLLGVREVVFLGYPDGSVVVSLDLRRDITRQIRRWRPELVVVTDPTFRFGDGYINHPDHRAVADAALDAVFPDSRNPRQFPELLLEEGLQPHHVGAVYISSSLQADTEVDITDFFHCKVAALKQHRSQISDAAHLEEWLRTWNGVEDGDGHMRYIERFKRITLERE